MACALQQDPIRPLAWSWHPENQFTAPGQSFFYPRQGVTQRGLHLLAPGEDTGEKEKVLEAETANHLGTGSLAKVLWEPQGGG